MRKKVMMAAVLAAATLCQGAVETLVARSEYDSSNLRTNFAGQIGFVFQSGPEAVFVDKLGFLDAQEDGLVSSHQVFLWDVETGGLILSVLVPSGTEAELYDGFRYVPVGTTIQLEANHRYAVAAEMINGEGQDPFFDITAATLSSYFTDGGFFELRYWGNLTELPKGGAGAGWALHRVYGSANIMTIPEMRAHDYLAGPVGEDGVVGVINGDQVEVDLSWKQALDPNGLDRSDITGHYLYLTEGEPNFVGMTPESISAGDAMVSITRSLAFDGVYYWRVDESVNDSGAGDAGTIVGAIRSFETIKSKPILEPLGNIYVKPGSDATFELTVKSLSPEHYQWYQSQDALMDPNDAMLGEDSGTLVLNEVQVTDGDSYYYCVVSNEGGESVSNMARLIVSRPMAMWELDGNLDDGSGNGWNGTAAAPVFAAGAGIRGDALELAANDTPVVIENSAGPFNFYPEGFSVGVWINIPEGLTNWRAAVSKQDRESQPWIGWVIGVSNTRQPFMTLRGVGGVIAADVELAAGEWYYLAGTYDAIGGKLTLSVNGVPVDETDVTVTPLPNDMDVVIGAENAAGTVSPFIGMIDEVTLYNYPLDRYEIADVYKSYTGKDSCIEDYLAAMDINDDCRIDMIDLSALTSGWLGCGLYPACP